MKLSDIKSKDLAKSRDFLEKVVFDANYQRIEETCAFGIVFGGEAMIPYRVDKALQAYQEGKVNTLVTTGEDLEAVIMYDYLCKKNVPDRDLIMAADPNNTSANTLENIKWFLNGLRRGCNLNEVKFAVITSDFNLRRSMAMLSKILNNSNNVFGLKAIDGNTDIESWKNTRYGHKIILSEARALCEQAKQGLIEDINIPELDGVIRKKLR